MTTVTTLKDYKVTHEIMEARLAGDYDVYYSEAQVTNSAYRCDGCGNIWAMKWYAETCEKRNHVGQFDQVYRHRAPGFQTTGRYEEVRYTRFRLGRDKRIAKPAIEARLGDLGDWKLNAHPVDFLA